MTIGQLEDHFKCNFQSIKYRIIYMHETKSLKIYVSDKANEISDSLLKIVPMVVYFEVYLYSNMFM